MRKPQKPDHILDFNCMHIYKEECKYTSIHIYRGTFFVYVTDLTGMFGDPVLVNGERGGIGGLRFGF